METKENQDALYKPVGWSDEDLKSFIRIIVDQLGVDESEIKPTSFFMDDLGADSLDTVELVCGFENLFGIKIPDEEVEGIKKVQDAIDKINEQKRGILYKIEQCADILADCFLLLQKKSAYLYYKLIYISEIINDI